MAIDEENIIEVTNEDGEVIKLELCDIIEFEGKHYALLLEADYEEDEDSEAVLMRYVEDGEDVFFEMIEDDDEFEKVQDYIESLEDELDEDEE